MDLVSAMSVINQYLVPTPLKEIEFPDFSKVCIKDESKNPTGTHKDRMAAVIAKYYIQNLSLNGILEESNTFPACSIISAGNAALAIANIFYELGLPPLKVLLDIKTDPCLKELLLENYCEIFTTDLTNEILNPSRILELTSNKGGIELTSFSNYIPDVLFYKDLVDELLVLDPEIIFVPYGSGQLFQNICARIYDRNINQEIGKRLLTNVIGVNTNNPQSKADKLFSAYSPFDFNSPFLSYMKNFNLIGCQSALVSLFEPSLFDAKQIFDENAIDAEYSACAGLAYLLENKDYYSSDFKKVVINTGCGIFEKKVNQYSNQERMEVFL